MRILKKNEILKIFNLYTFTKNKNCSLQKIKIQILYNKLSLFPNLWTINLSFLFIWTLIYILFNGILDYTDHSWP